MALLLFYYLSILGYLLYLYDILVHGCPTGGPQTACSLQGVSLWRLDSHPVVTIPIAPAVAA